MAVDDQFKIILSPTFEFNKEKIQSEINKLKIPNIKFVGDLDVQATKENINKKLEQIKFKKINLQFDFNVKEFRERVNEQIKNLKLNKTRLQFELDIDDSMKSINKQLKDLKLDKIKTEEDTEKKNLSTSQSSNTGLNYLKSQTAIYKELQKQEKALYDLRNKQKVGSDDNISDYQVLIQKQEETVRNIREEIKERKLNNNELEEHILNLQKIKNLSLSDKEASRQAKLGKEINNDSGAKLNFDSGLEEIEDFAKSLGIDNATFEKVTALKTKVQDLHNAQKQFTVSFKTGRGEITEYTYAIDKASGKVFEMGNKVRRVNTTIAGFGSLLSEMVEKVFQWNIATTAVYKSLEFLQRGFNFMVDLDTALTEVALVTGKAREEVGGLKEEYLALAESTKKTVSEISKLNVELVRQGLSQEETDARMDTILKLSAVGSMDSEETLSVITSSVNALGEEAKKTADILVYADNASASSVESIGTAMTKVASTAQTTGVSIEQLVGQVSTLIDVTQEAPETLGNSLKSIMARFSKVNELGEINQDINDVEKAFKQVGIAFKDSEGQIRPFYELMSDMAGEWDSLDKNTKSMVATLAAGTQQQNRFLVLMQNWDRVTKMTTELENNSSGSLDKGYDVWTDSLQADINELKISFEELWMTMLDEGALGDFINLLSGIVNIINMFAEKVDLIKVAIILGFSELFKIPLDKKLLNLIGTISSKLLIFKKNTSEAKKELDKFENSIANGTKDIKKNTDELIQNTNATKDKARADKNASSEVENMGQSAGKAEIGFIGMAKAVNTSKLAVIGLKAAASMGISLLMDFITWAGTKIWDVIKESSPAAEEVVANLQEITNSFKDLTSNFTSDIKTLKEIGKEFETLSAIVGKNNDLTKLSAEEKDRYLEISQQIADIAPEFVNYWDIENGAMIEHGKTIDEIIAKKKELYELEKAQLLVDFQENAKHFGKIETKVANANALLDLKKFDVLSLGSDVANRWDWQLSRVFDKWTMDLLGSMGIRFDYSKRVDHIPDRYNFIKKQEAIINNPNSSDEEKLKAQKEIDKASIAMSKLNAEQRINNQEIENFIAQNKQFLNLRLPDYYEELGDSISDFDKNLISESSNKYIESLIKDSDYEDKENAINDSLAMAITLTDISKQVRDSLDDLTPKDLTDNISELQKLEQQLIDLGMSEELAAEFINNLAIEITGLGYSSENTAGKIESLTSTISNGLSKMNSLQELYKKTLNGSLTFEDITKFGDENPEEYLEFLEKINEGMEINSALREVISEQTDKISSEVDGQINNEIKANEEKKKQLLEQQSIYQNMLRTWEEKGDTETSQYRALEEETKKIEEALKNVDEESKNLTVSLGANNKLFQEFVNKDLFDTADEQFKSATDNISKYNEMLSTLNEEGISGNLLKTILSDYPDLIMFIDDEIALREYLNNLIIAEEEAQKESYKLKLMYNENFCNAFLKNNADMINQLSEKYKVDLKNFANLQNQKMALQDAAERKLATQNVKLSEDVFNMTSDQIAEKIKETKEYIGTIERTMALNNITDPTLLNEYKAELEVYKDAENYINSVETSIDNVFNKVDFNAINKVSSGSVGSGSSNSKSKKKTIDFVELEKEQYLKLNKELEKNNRLRDKNNQLMEYAYGADKIKLLDKENELLTQRQQLDNQLANKYREEQTKLKSELGKTIDISSNSTIMDSFAAYMTKKENEINLLIKQINTTTNESTVDSLTEKKDKIQKEVDKIAEQYKRYIEITFTTIPDLQDDYTNAIFEKFDNMVEAMQIKLEKYEKEVSRLNILKDLKITGKIDDTSELKQELAIHKEISTIYLNELSITKQKAKESQDEVTRLQNLLNSIKDKSSTDYKNQEENLLRAKFLADEALQMYESNLQSYADALNSKVSIEIQLIDKLREETKESLQDLRKEADEFTLDSFTNSLKEIELALNKIDGIFIKNPSYVLDTSDTRNEIKDISKTIEQIRKNTDKWKDSIEKVRKSNKTNKEIIEDVEVIIKELIKTENEINEQIANKTQEIENMQLEYQQIEDSLQNQIDLKEEELEKIQEEYEQEQKINSLIEKRLQLLKALDDTSHMYVTGQGTVEWTYDKYQVDGLLQELSEENNQNEQDKLTEAMQQEIDKMVENLETTKEIHQQNLAVNEAQLEQLEQEKDYIGSIIENSLESLDENFDNMIDTYIDEMNQQFEKNTGVLIDIYNLLKQDVGSKGFNYKDVATTEVSVGKNEETLEKIAKKYGTSIQKLIELNLGLGVNSILNFGQKIKIPTFDTGGYTGSFGNEGRLAILHQKELVLNQNDTKNLLNIVDVARNIIGSIGNIKLENREVTTPTTINIDNITFPNVNNANQFINDLQRFARGGMGRLS